MPRAPHNTEPPAPPGSVVSFIECKTFGHAWDEYNPIGPDGYIYESFDRLTLRCTRCGTTRHDYLSRMGDVEYRQYDYPDRYRTTPDNPRPSRAVMRLLLHHHDVPSELR